MPKRKNKSVKPRKNTVAEYVACIAGAAVLFLLGAAEILDSHAVIGRTRRVPGREFFGLEAWTIGSAHVALGSLLLLWLCRGRPWHFAAICAALVVNAAVVILAFTRA